jgi:hypothetical protein
VNILRGQQADDATQQLTDEQALARYRYLLKTAPPEDIERAHEEAFAQLTPEQRRQALDALAQHVPANELRGDDPASLARTATRAELRQPGTIERAWGSGAAGFGLGSWFMATLAASFIGSAIGQMLFDQDPNAAEASGESTAEAGDQGASETDTGWEDTNADGGGDLGGGDIAGGDFGGGDFGGDLGGF